MINSHKVQHIFFDLDHTLWDFEKNSGATFKSIFEELNFEFSLEQFLDFYNPINIITGNSIVRIGFRKSSSVI